MTMRTFTVVYFLLAAALVWPGVARAQDLLIGADGCAILASLVYAEVTEARPGFSPGHGIDPLYAGRNEITLCTRATRSVTSAYSAALRQSNIFVTWGFHAGYDGDYCLSHVLSQCYPTGNPAMPPLGEDERSFLVRSWHAVRDSVHFRMAQYPGSDVARFRDHDLRQSIRRSIRFGAIEQQSPTFLR
jgi:hypothetical protein